MLTLNSVRIRTVEDALRVLPADAVVVNDPDDDGAYETKFFLAALRENPSMSGQYTSYTAQEWADYQQACQ